MDKLTARDYIRANFHEDDRLAIVLIQKSTGAVTQRIADVDRITSDQFQGWLRYMNSRKHEVYISMNALNKDASGRTKADVAAVRHIYLDFDKDGPEAIRAMREREDLPTPNHILQSSPGRFQVLWRAEGFEKEDAESLMRGLVRELGADPAATDSARVLRVPGFFNHKYGTPYFVAVETLSQETHTPTSFPRIADGERAARDSTPFKGLPGRRDVASQSERDWAYALRALARGDDPEVVANLIATFRSDKPDPKYYADLTVRKAAGVLTSNQDGHESRPGGHER